MSRFILSIALAWLLSLTTTTTQARQSKQWVKVGTSVPYQLAAQVEWQTRSNFYFSAELGSFVQPYQDLIIGHLSKVSANPIIPALTGAILEEGRLSALRAGKLIGPNNRLQVGGYLQRFAMQGNRKPTSLVGKYFDVDPNSLPTISLASQITIAGVDLGVRMPLTPKFSIHASVSMGYAIHSNTELGSSEEGFDQMAGALAKEANQAIQSNGFLPSVNVFLAYRLFGQNTGKHGKTRSKKDQKLLSRKIQQNNAPSFSHDEVDR